MKKIWLCLLTIMAGVGGLEAQQPAPAPPPLPEGPILKLPSGNARWVIAVTSKVAGGSGGEAKDMLVEKITVARSGNVQLEERVKAESKDQIWQVGEYRVTVRSNSPFPMVQKVPTDDKGEANPAAQYPGFEWVAPDKYVGPEREGSGVRLIFKDPLTESTAAVDASTRYPLFAEQVSMKYTYQFLSAGGGLTVPEEVQKAISESKERMERASRRAVRPY